MEIIFSSRDCCSEAACGCGATFQKDIFTAALRGNKIVWKVSSSDDQNENIKPGPCFARLGCAKGTCSHQQVLLKDAEHFPAFSESESSGGMPSFAWQCEIFRCCGGTLFPSVAEVILTTNVPTGFWQHIQIDVCCSPAFPTTNVLVNGSISLHDPDQGL